MAVSLEQTLIFSNLFVGQNVLPTTRLTDSRLPKADSHSQGGSTLSRFKVFITRPIPEEIRVKIAAECDVDMWHTSAILPPIAEKIPPLDGLMTYGHEPVSPEMIATAPNLSLIHI